MDADIRRREIVTAVVASAGILALGVWIGRRWGKDSATPMKQTGTPPTTPANHSKLMSSAASVQAPPPLSPDSPISQASEPGSQLRVAREHRRKFSDQKVFRPPFPPEITNLLEAAWLCYLSTSLSDAPHVSLMAFTYDKDTESVIFSTRRDTWKCRALERNPHCAFLVHDFPALKSEPSFTVNENGLNAAMKELAACDPELSRETSVDTRSTVATSASGTSDGVTTISDKPKTNPSQSSTKSGSGSTCAITLYGTARVLPDGEEAERFRKIHRQKSRPESAVFIEGKGIAIVIVEVDKASVCDKNDKVVCWDVERGWEA